MTSSRTPSQIVLAAHDRVMRWHGSVVLAFLVWVFLAATSVQAQTQLGADIDGEGFQDSSGSSVALSSDGSRVAIGAPFNDGNGSGSGHVRVYDWNGSAWVQVGSDIDGEAANDYSGWSVALSSDGSRVAIGAPYNDGNASGSGHVRVYDWSSSAWVQVGSDIDGEAIGDLSGWSVALSSDGSRVAIGAGWHDTDNSGHVRVYDWNSSAWVQVGSDIDGEAANDHSGYSVALSADGSRVAIGAILNGGNGSNSGHVRVYDWNSSAWVQVGSDIDGEAAGDESGFFVVLSSDGSRVAIGAPFNDGNGNASGHVRVYDWNSSAWVQVGSDIDGEVAGDQCGWSVALSSDGSRVAIGANENDGNGGNSGHVRVYDWNGSAWVQACSDIDGESAGDRSGYSVTLSSGGSRVAIGASGASGSGHVRVFVIGTMEHYGTGCILTLTASAAPCIPNGFGNVGTTVELRVDGIPTTAITNFIVYNFVPIPFGLDLSAIGAPGCFLYVANPTIYASHAATSSTTDAFPTNAPWVFHTPGWRGLPVHFQAGSWVPTTVNPLGLLTSNGLTLTAY